MRFRFICSNDCNMPLSIAPGICHHLLSSSFFSLSFFFQAPAAFGLVSFLLHENFDRDRIRKHLLVFSVAAPLLTVITYFGLSQVSFAAAVHSPNKHSVGHPGYAIVHSQMHYMNISLLLFLLQSHHMGSHTPSSEDLSPLLEGGCRYARSLSWLKIVRT